MTEKWKTEFFEALSKRIETYTTDNLLIKNEANGAWMIKTVFATSPEKKYFVMVQGAAYQAREDVLLLEIYIMLTDEAKKEAMPQMQEAIDELNSYLPIGTLGIYPGDGHIYLRYCFKLPAELSVEKCVDDAIVDYELIMEVVTAAYPGLSRIWSGEMTFEQTVETKLLNRHSMR